MPIFCEKVLLRGQNFVPATCCMNSLSWFEFVRHLKQGQNDLNFQYRILCTALANVTCYNIEMNQYPLRVHQLTYCACNMHPI